MDRREVVVCDIEDDVALAEECQNGLRGIRVWTIGMR